MAVKTTRESYFRTRGAFADQVLEWIGQQDSAVTVRRVFYAMVSHYGLDNTLNNYKIVSANVTRLRRMGRLDWSAIEDSTRSAYKSESHDSAESCLRAALRRFRLDRWEDQPYHVEVWVEKRGHVSVLFALTNGFDVILGECGGRRALNEASVASLLEAQEAGKKNVILYVGDYDPTGLQNDVNMKRQLREWGVEAKWVRVALLRKQLAGLPRAYTIPDKVTPGWLSKHPWVEIIGHNEEGQPQVNKLEKDSSARWFRERHSGELFQVEVDALEVATLREHVRVAIEKYLDRERYDRILEREEAEREAAAERLQG